MDPMLIIAAVNAGVSIFKGVQTAEGSLLTAKQQAIMTAGASIVQAATGLYTTVQADLSANDQATVDAALQAAHDQCGTDLARVLAEIAADA